jgi:2-polyprenyl-3-methyl-5-hydroxy-6-metoxy-1,4-benzoquinol methylase
LSFHCDKVRTYLRCQQCSLVFVPEHQHLSPAQEKAIYDLHQNQGDDPGYRQFLSRLATPLLQSLKPQSKGLDYGCGPGPLLAQLLREHGHHVELYDPFYAANSTYRRRRYDFVTCSEVVEHFRQPGREFEHLFALLQPRGKLAVMTKLVIDAPAFAKWHYKNDPTHISFFSRTSLQWLADHYGKRLSIMGNDVALFTEEE